MITEVLKDIGLSGNETKIYLALLDLGPSLMGELCGKTKIHRRNVYDSIEMLKDKGFVSSTIINNRNVFEAVNPERILQMIDEKKASVESILPELLVRRNDRQADVRVYTGLNGRKIIFEDKLKYKEEQYVLGAHEPSQKSSTYIQNYHRRRIQRRINLKMLFINQDKGAAIEFSRMKYIDARILPNKFSSPIAINIYGDKTAILLGSSTIEPISILIEDKGLAQDFKSYFDLLWSISREL